MTNLDHSIKKTITYAGYFNFSLSIDEIYLWLISSKRVSKEKIISKYINKIKKKQLSKKRQKELLSIEKIKQAKKIALVLSRIPTILMIAVTGSVAVNNTSKDDDIDLMIVTKNNSLWITRLITTFIISFTGRRRYPKSSKKKSANTFCLNLWLEEKSLKIDKNNRNLYTAHEVLQIVPVYDSLNTYNNFIKQNSWAKKYLANAYYEKTKNTSINTTRTGLSMSSVVYFPLNFLAYCLQRVYMNSKITTEKISFNSAFFHSTDYFEKISTYLKKKI